MLPTIDTELKPGVTVTEDTQFANDVESKVHNPDALVPTQTDTDQATITVKPIGGGEGPDLVDKRWLEKTVPALSRDQRVARLSWSTQGLPFTSMRITDPASDNELTNVSNSVYDAFDLQRIEPITTSTDPLIAGDKVSKVELYSAGSGWVDITAAACANGCTGTFGGYTLTAAQQASTLGVRMTIVAQDGGRVGSSYGNNRPIDLLFAVRDKLRSDPSQWVLGQYHSYTYNTGDAGLVDNTVKAEGVGPVYSHTTTDHDTILIVDSPVNVTSTKSFDQSQLGLPAAGTQQSGYPLITGTLTATNRTASRIASLTLTDPDADQAAPTAFDVLNLYSIDNVVVPSGLTISDVTIQLRSGPGWASPIPLLAAEALTPDELADVTGVRVIFDSGNGQVRIASGATAGIDLTYQLRGTHRGDGSALTTTPRIDNVAGTQAESPGRIVCDDNGNPPGCSTGRSTAEDHFAIVDATYQVRAGKSISPTSVAENGSRSYKSTITGQSLGNARTTLMTLTDDRATFWNTMGYASSSIVMPRPVNQARMDVLVGTQLVYSGGVLKQTCPASSPNVDDLTACWVNGAWVSSSPGSTVNFSLPSATPALTAADVRGVRYDFRQLDSDGDVLQWERPYNPLISVALRTTRLTNLRIDRAGQEDVTPVPSDRPDLLPGPGETDKGRITNTVDVHGDAQFGPAQTFTDDDSATVTTLITRLVNKIKVEKYPGNATGRPPVFSADAPVPYVMKVTNTGSWPMTGLTIVDQVQTDGSGSLLREANGASSYTITQTYQGSTTALPWAAALDTTTGKVSVAVPADYVFQPGAVITINAAMKFRDELAPSTTVSNAITATSDRPFEQCQFTHNSGAGTPTTNVNSCTADTVVQPLAEATLNLKKYVKGKGAGAPGSSDGDLGVLATDGSPASSCDSSAADADGFYTFPCAPVTRPGGLETWRLDIRNEGNTPANVVAAVDRLPEPGDQGPYTGADRGSMWRTLFRGNVTYNSASVFGSRTGAFTTYYSTYVGNTNCNSNAIRVETSGATPDPSCAFNWQPLTGSESDTTLDSIRSVKFVLKYDNADEGMSPNQVLQVGFDTKTPNQLANDSAVADGLPVAYNSYVASSRTATVTNQPGQGQLLLEPSKVGVATATGQLQLSKVVVAPDDFGGTLPSSYRMGLACTSGGQNVSLTHPDGSDASVITVPADGSTKVNSSSDPVNLPLFSDCKVTEQNLPVGATVSYDPASQQVTALRSLDDNPSVNHPYTIPDADASKLKLKATNTFTAGGFQVSKAVDNGGAVDQDGQAIQYDETYAFSASCTWEGQQVAGPLDQSFTLKKGDTKQFTGLPTGSVCTVTETNAGSSASTGVTVEGAPGSTTTDSSATFTVGTGAATSISVAFTNHYEIGSLKVTKAVDGPGAADWGQANFTLRLVCTLDTASPTTVFDDTHTLKAGESWQVDQMPAGATCTFTEPESGGANNVDLPDPVTIVAGTVSDPTLATVTNTFDVGALKVTKTVSGDGSTSGSVVNGRYTMTLACTREVNGATESIAIPGGASATITAAESHTWTGLPTGASCTIEETKSDPPAQSTTISPAGPYIIGSGDDATVNVNVDNTFGGGYVQVVKEVKGPGAEDFSTKQFGIHLVCTFGADKEKVLDETFTLAWDGQSATISSATYGPVPVNSSCTATETDNGGADKTPDPVTVVVPEGTTATAPVQLGLTNRYSAGTVSLTKRVNGSDANSQDVQDALFTLQVKCQLEIDGQRVTLFSGNVVLQSGETVNLIDDEGKPVLLPVDTRCFVTEIDSAGADKVTIVHHSYDTALVVKAGTSEDPQELKLLAVNTFNKAPTPSPPVPPIVPSPSTAPPGGGNGNATPPGGSNESLPILPGTGGPARGLVALGGLLVAAGVGTLWFARRRRARPQS